MHCRGGTSALKPPQTRPPPCRDEKKQLKGASHSSPPEGCFSKPIGPLPPSPCTFTAPGAAPGLTLPHGFKLFLTSPPSTVDELLYRRRATLSGPRRYAGPERASVDAASTVTCITAPAPAIVRCGLQQASGTDAALLHSGIKEHGAGKVHAGALALPQLLLLAKVVQPVSHQGGERGFGLKSSIQPVIKVQQGLPSALSEVPALDHGITPLPHTWTLCVPRSPTGGSETHQSRGAVKWRDRYCWGRCR